MKLVELVGEGVAVSLAARTCGMSRAKAYKWLARFQQGGKAALEDRSRARLDTGRLEGPLAERLVGLRQEHVTWGPRKLLAFLEREGLEELPAPSTVGALLARRGLIQPRQRHRSHVPFRYAGPVPSEPNARWTMDFKGDFRLGDGQKCLPFTLRDAASRKLLSIRAMRSTCTELVMAELERAFREFGLPIELQSDCGSPFATRGIARLSRLSVWLLKLGVIPVLSRPGKPQDNGGHERMHRDLKAETTRPPGRNAADQQKKFDAFLRCFNEKRPHEALGGDVPDEHWVRSSRSLPRRIAAPEYPAWWEIRRVNRSAATFSWHSQPIDISDALCGEDIGFEPIDDGLWRIHIYRFAIGLLDERGDTPVVISTPRDAGRLVMPTNKNAVRRR